MKDKKTTLAAALKMGAIALGLIGYNFSDENQAAILTAAGVVYGVFSFLQGYFTKDSKEE